MTNDLVRNRTSSGKSPPSRAELYAPRSQLLFHRSRIRVGTNPSECPRVRPAETASSLIYCSIIEKNFRAFSKSIEESAIRIKKGLLRNPAWRKGERLYIRIYSEELILHSICGACLATGLQSRNSRQLIAAEALYYA